MPLSIQIVKNAPITNIITDIENIFSEICDSAGLALTNEDYPTLTITGASSGSSLDAATLNGELPSYYNITLHSIGDLNDVNMDTVSDGNILKWNDSAGEWQSSNSIDTLASISDVNITSVSNNHILKWDSSTNNWINGPNEAITNNTSKSFTAADSQTEFDISDIYPETVGAVSVYVNGLYQLNTQDYTVDDTSGSEKINFVSGCTSGDRVVVNINTTDTTISMVAHEHDDRYLKLTGGIITGNLKIAGTSKNSGVLYSGTTDPSNTTRLNYDGYFYATRLYNSVYNDYAEAFENLNNLDYNKIRNRIVEVDESGVIRIAFPESDTVIGIVSDNYGHLLGASEEEINCGKKIPIGLTGTLWVDSENCVDNSNIGRFICSGKEGKARVVPKGEAYIYEGSIVGKIIQINEYNNQYKILINLK